jgi:hypothetical protein
VESLLSRMREFVRDTNARHALPDQ